MQQSMVKAKHICSLDTCFLITNKQKRKRGAIIWSFLKILCNKNKGLTDKIISSSWGWCLAGASHRSPGHQERQKHWWCPWPRGRGCMYDCTWQWWSGLTSGLCPVSFKSEPSLLLIKLSSLSSGVWSREMWNSHPILCGSRKTDSV